MNKTVALIGALAVALGALGAHGLQDLIAPSSLASFRTGVWYHLLHAVALLAITRGSFKRITALLWVWGIVFFSGSIYLLAIDEYFGLSLSFLGPITPIGGILLISGWLTLIVSNEKNVDK